MSTTEEGLIWDRLLISICNSAVDPKPSCLLLLDPYSSTTRWIAIGPPEDLHVSGVGLFAADEWIYHLSITASFTTRLSVLERSTLALVHSCDLPQVQDPHSVCAFDGGLAIASTGTDEIHFYPLTEGEPSEKAEILWAASDAHTDTHHVNSLTVDGGRLLCTAFGPRGPGTWATADDGYVLDVATNEKLLTGLHQPHSLVMVDSEPFVCNSREGAVRRGEAVIAHTGGYARGLAFGRTGTMYVGSSFARTSGRQRDAFENPGDRGRLRGRCTVAALPLRGVRTEWDLSRRGFEIYDILVIEKGIHG